MDIGVFIPINNNGWIISAASPQYMPSFELNWRVVEKAEAFGFDKWDAYNEGADGDALAHLLGKAAEDTAPSVTSMAAAVLRSPSSINFNMGTLVGSHANVARMLDEVAGMPGVKGIMLTFDDFLAGMDAFGTRVQPLMKCRGHVEAAA